MPKGDATWPAMTIDECLAFADEWVRGLTLHAGSQGWRVVCMLLAEEVRRLRSELDEQCRLLGMGSEREARLMVQLAESRAKECRMREALRLCSGVLEEDGRVATVWHAQSALEATSDDSALREMIKAAKTEEREAVLGAIERAWYAQGLDVRGANISEFITAIRARSAQ